MICSRYQLPSTPVVDAVGYHHSNLKKSSAVNAVQGHNCDLEQCAAPAFSNAGMTSALTSCHCTCLSFHHPSALPGPLCVLSHMLEALWHSQAIEHVVMLKCALPITSLLPAEHCHPGGNIQELWHPRVARRPAAVSVYPLGDPTCTQTRAPESSVT